MGQAFTVGGARSSWVLGPYSCRKVSSPVDSEACVYRAVGGRVLNGQVQWMDVQSERLLARSVVHRTGAAGTRQELQLAGMGPSSE